MVDWQTNQHFRGQNLSLPKSKKIFFKSKHQYMLKECNADTFVIEV